MFVAKNVATRGSFLPQPGRRNNNGDESGIKIAELNTREQSDGNWSSFQLAKSTPPQSVIDYAIAPSARIPAPGALAPVRLHSSRASVIVQWFFISREPHLRRVIDRSALCSVQLSEGRVCHRQVTCNSVLTRSAHRWAEQVDRARTHMSDERNFAVGDAETPPRALQTSECSELLDPTRKSCLILFQRQPGKLWTAATAWAFPAQESRDAALFPLAHWKRRR